MKKSYLLIGGTRDGQWRQLESEDHIVEIRTDAKPIPVDSPLLRSISMPPIETYRRESFTYANNKTMFYVYVFDRISNDNMLRMLVDGYRQPKQVTQ